MSIEAIGDGLKTVLDTISGLKVSALNELPDKAHPPHAIILLGETAYHRTYGNSPYEADLIFRIIVLLGNQDSPSAANRMIDYIEASGSSSIVAAVEADPTLNSTCDGSVVTHNFGLGITNWAGIQYLSTEFEITIAT